jgi:hypothetical protein
MTACAWHVLQGVENVYTQHTPLLVHTLEALVRGRLRDADYPHIDKAANGAQPPYKVPKVRPGPGSAAWLVEDPAGHSRGAGHGTMSG